MALIKRSSGGQGGQGGLGVGEKSSPAEATHDEYNEPTVGTDDAAFAAIEGVGDFTHPDPGTYQAIVNEVSLRPLTERGRSIQAQFVLVLEDDNGNVAGRRFSTFFKVLEPDGRTPSGGASFYNTFMAKLGYEKGNRGQKSLDEINETKPAVSLKLTANGQYPPNCAVMFSYEEDTEEIAALREWIEGQPF